MNVLVIAPHPDDESIGCGGTICLHTARGDRVAVVFLTSGELGLRGLPKEEAWRVREREAEKAADILGIDSVTFLRRPDRHVHEHIDEAADALKPILTRETSQLIYLTNECDRHPDHRAAVPIVQAALAGCGIPAPTLLSYEVLTFLTEYDRLEDITPMMGRKLSAVRAHRSQVRQFRYDRAARSLNEYRATLAETGRYAEVFQFADGRVSAVPRGRRADPAWYRAYGVTTEIASVVPPDVSFILVDDGNLEAAPLLAPRRCIPFLEKDGIYWGRPADDETAIRELAGASFVVFTWPALWWLDHYSGLRNHLRSQFHCVRNDDSVVAFDLKVR
jgi:LmbE family N-acetylglucosaminyl deacetylase